MFQLKMTKKASPCSMGLQGVGRSRVGIRGDGARGAHEYLSIILQMVIVSGPEPHRCLYLVGVESVNEGEAETEAGPSPAGAEGPLNQSGAFPRQALGHRCPRPHKTSSLRRGWVSEYIECILL